MKGGGLFLRKSKKEAIEREREASGRGNRGESNANGASPAALPSRWRGEKRRGATCGIRTPLGGRLEAAVASAGGSLAARRGGVVVHRRLRGVVARPVGGETAGRTPISYRGR